MQSDFSRRSVRLLLTAILVFCFSGAVYAGNLTAPADSFFPSPSAWEKAAFWRDKFIAPERPWMSSKDIAIYNRQGMDDPYALRGALRLPRNQNLDDLKKYFNDLVPESRFKLKENDKELNAAAVKKCLDNMGREDLPELTPGYLALVVEETCLRRLPTLARMVLPQTAKNQDANLVGAAALGSPAAIFWLSRDKKWALAQTDAGRGWLPLQSLALERQRGQIKEYDAYPRIAVVTVPRLRLAVKGAIINLPMGTRLPMDKEGPGGAIRLWIPSRDQDGLLFYQMIPVTDPHAVQEGFLPCTPRVILDLAFAWLPEAEASLLPPDDPEFVWRSVFACCGIYLPHGLLAGGREFIKPFSLKAAGDKEELLKVLNSAPPLGTLLLTDAGVLLLLGRDGDDLAVLSPPYALTVSRLFGLPINGPKRFAPLKIYSSQTPKMDLLETVKAIHYIAPEPSPYPFLSR